MGKQRSYFISCMLVNMNVIIPEHECQYWPQLSSWLDRKAIRDDPLAQQIMGSEDDDFSPFVFPNCQASDAVEHAYTSNIFAHVGLCLSTISWC